MELGYAHNYFFNRQIPQGNEIYNQAPWGRSGNYFASTQQTTRISFWPMRFCRIQPRWWASDQIRSRPRPAALRSRFPSHWIRAGRACRSGAREDDIPGQRAFDPGPEQPHPNLEMSGQVEVRSRIRRFGVLGHLEFIGSRLISPAYRPFPQAHLAADCTPRAAFLSQSQEFSGIDLATWASASISLGGHFGPRHSIRSATPQCGQVWMSGLAARPAGSSPVRWQPCR